MLFFLSKYLFAMTSTLVGKVFFIFFKLTIKIYIYRHVELYSIKASIIMMRIMDVLIPV